MQIPSWVKHYLWFNQSEGFLLVAEVVVAGWLNWLPLEILVEYRFMQINLQDNNITMDDGQEEEEHKYPIHREDFEYGQFIVLILQNPFSEFLNPLNKGL